MKNSEEEIISYTSTLNYIINSLLKEIEKIHEKNEEYFNECSILGVDRIQLLEDIKNLLKKYQEDTLKNVLDYQSTEIK